MKLHMYMEFRPTYAPQHKQISASTCMHKPTDFTTGMANLCHACHKEEKRIGVALRECAGLIHSMPTKKIGLLCSTQCTPRPVHIVRCHFLCFLGPLFPMPWVAGGTVYPLVPTDT